MASTAVISSLEFTRFVQSSFRIKGGGLVVYVDPHRLTPKEAGADKADLVLVTHPHFDHLDRDAIDAVRKADTVIVASVPCTDGLRGAGAVVAVREGDATTQRGVEIRAVAGYNSYHRREEGFNVGYVFKLAGVTIFHAGDTGRVPEFKKLGPIDVAMVPIGGTYTMDEAEAAAAVREDIRPRAVIPMHYGYATGGDPQRFRRLVGEATVVEILEPVLRVKAR